MDHNLLLILVTCTVGFIMTWGVGANDLANVMSTTMGSKALTVRQALLIAIVFEFAGAILGSGGVSDTLRSGIINVSAYGNDPQILVQGMLAVLLAGTCWMLLASYLGLPVSITNAIVGGLVGFGVIVLGPHAIYWPKVRWIALSWITSPLLAGIVAYALFRSVQRLILIRVDPLHQAKRFLPLYLFLIGIVLAFMTVLKGIRHVGINLSLPMEWMVILVTAILVTLAGVLISKRICPSTVLTTHEQFAAVEKLFGILMGFTACAMVFAHGSNDVAIAVGPMAAILSLTESHLKFSLHTTQWIVIFGCLGVVTGFLMYGRKVIETVGSGITTLTPSRAFAATLSAASTVILSTSTGIPVSATQTLVGGVLGVGLARGIGALNLNVVRNILLSWLVTIPAASLLAIGFFYLFQKL